MLVLLLYCSIPVTYRSILTNIGNVRYNSIFGQEMRLIVVMIVVGFNCESEVEIVRAHCG